MTFIERIRARAAAEPRRIAFPESDDERTLEAVRELARSGIAVPVVVLGEGSGNRKAGQIAGVEVVHAPSDSFADEVMAELVRRRAHHGLPVEEARRLSRTPLYFADGLVASGRVDGCVAGAVHTTAAVVRAALWLVGTAPRVQTISGAFYMVTAPFRGGPQPEVLSFADCSVVRYPTADQLAEIAIATATDRRWVVGDEPIVALLSFSTKGSAAGSSVALVRQALEAIRERAPWLPVDGELQLDAAVIPEVASRKVPESTVAGRANVLIFPSLDAGNIGYKLVERLAGATAVGPILQGFRRPCSDLSRGAVVEDIINVAAVTALQASGALELPRNTIGKETKP